MWSQTFTNIWLNDENVVWVNIYAGIYNFIETAKNYLHISLKAHSSCFYHTIFKVECIEI